MASNILPLFWPLASSSKDARLGASANLISTLEGFQSNHVRADSDDEDEDEDDDDESGIELDGSDDEEGGDKVEAALDAALSKENAEDVAYSVKRLIRGLASSRESSRFGFSVALTELLQRVNTVTPAQTLSLIKRNSHTSKSMKGSEERDALFARLFGVTALIESGALLRSGSSSSDFAQAVDVLVELGNKKNWLRESAWWAVVQAVQALLLASPEWEQEGLDKIASLLQADKSWTQEKLALALILEKARPDVELKSVAIRHAPVLSSQNLPMIARILRDSHGEDDGAAQGSWKPQLHFVWTFIFDSLLSSSAQTSFQDFFRIVVDESLLANTASPQKRYWGFQVFITALPRVSPDIMPQLFTPNFMRCWMNNLSSSDRYLHKAAQTTASVVQDVVKANPNVGFSLLSRLIGKHGRADFDRVTKTKTVESILASLNVEGVQEYVAYLKGVIIKDDETERSDPKALADRRKWAIEQLSSLVRSSKVPKSDEWVSDVLDFLLIHGLFQIKKADKKSNITAVQLLPNPALSAGSTATCRERFFASVLDLTTLSPPRDGEKRFEQGCDSTGRLWLRRSLDLVQRLEKDKHFELLMETDEEIKQMRSDAMVLLEQIKKNTTKQSADIVKGSEVLLCYAVLQTYDESEDMLETLEDVSTAVKQMFTKSKASEEDAEPIDLLLDTLIALLDKGSGGLRSLANMVLALSAPALTSSSIEHLLAQLEAAPAPIEGPEIDAEGLEQEDEGDVEDVDMDDDANEDEEEDDEDEDESDDDVELDDDEDMGDVDPAFRKRVEEALKAAGMDPEGDGRGDEDESDGDESSDEEELWDDDQMMKVDEQLAKVFKDRKEGNSKQKAKRMLTDNVHFKTRILDLFDTFIRKQPSSPLILDTVLPLLRLVRRAGDEAVLASKTAGIIRQRFDKPKEVPTVDIDAAEPILEEIHNLARRANSDAIASAALSCSLFVSRCIAQSDSASGAVTKAYAATVDDHMTRKGSQVRIPFLREYIKRFPTQAWALRATITKYIAQGQGYHPFRQTKMYELIAVYSSLLATIAKSVPESEVEQFATEVRASFVDTIQRAAAASKEDEESASSWKTPWLKDAARQVLHLARSSKAVLSHEAVVRAWKPAELETLLETIQSSEATGKMTGLVQLLKQMRAILDKSEANGSGKGNTQKRKAEAAAKESAQEAGAPAVKGQAKTNGKGEKKRKVKSTGS